MRSLEQQILAYSAYHQNFWNKFCHFFGVPIVVFSIFLPMAWFRFRYSEDVPLSAATMFYVSVLFYYLKLDWVVALMQLPTTLVILWLAEEAAKLPFAESAMVFGASFVGGWLIQLAGHVFEGKRPALTDNLLQIFNAPLFLTVEILFFLGFRKELKAKVAGAT